MVDLINAAVVRAQNTWYRMRHDEEGQTLVEYGLIIAIIALGAVVALTFLSSKINDLFSKTGKQLASDDNSGVGDFSQIKFDLGVGTYYAGVSGAGNFSYDPKTGAELWHFDWPGTTIANATVLTPTKMDATSEIETKAAHQTFMLCRNTGRANRLFRSG